MLVKKGRAKMWTGADSSAEFTERNNWTAGSDENGGEWGGDDSKRSERCQVTDAVEEQESNTLTMMQTTAAPCGCNS